MCKMHRLRRKLVATYLTFDPRSLGSFRILLGLVLLADLYRRYLGVDFFYTDDGLIPGGLLARSDFRWVPRRGRPSAAANCRVV